MLTRAQLLRLAIYLGIVFAAGVFTGRESMSGQIHDLKAGWAECVLTATDPAKPLCPKNVASEDAVIPDWVNHMPHDERVEWLELKARCLDAETVIVNHANAIRTSCNSL